MFRSILFFEIRYHLRQPLLYITVGLFALMAFGAVSSDSVVIGGGIGNVHRNAPVVIMQILTVLSVIGLFVVTAFVASSINRDFERGTHEMFFSRPVPKSHYLLGRFIGSMTVSMLIFLGPVLGIIVGSYMPWLEAERLGPFMAEPYVFTMLVMVLPNILIMGAVFFVLAGITRSLLATYLGVVGTFVVYTISRILTSDLDSELLGSLTDPFGLAPLQEAIQYWTVVERNTMVPEIGGALLANRLIWLGVGLAVLAFGVWRFSYTQAISKRRRKVKTIAEASAAATVRPLAPELPQVRRSFSGVDTLKVYLRQSWLDASGVFRGIPFLIILAFGLFNLLVSTSFADILFGTSVYPVTHLMLQHLNNAFLFLLVIVLTFYGGELIFRERSLRVNEVNDALPVANGVFFAAKLTALMIVVVTFLVTGMLATMGYQLYRGYTMLELGLYAKGFLMVVIPFAMFAVLAAIVQVLANNKFVGYLLMILFLISGDVLNSLDLQHRLYHFADSPAAPYSDMNGYGHFVAPTAWFSLYWSLFCVVLIGLGSIFWVRGTEGSWKTRWKQARLRFRSPAGVMVAAGLVCFIATGGYIYFNTNILNEYMPNDRQELLQAEYEKRYRQHLDLEQPRITDVYADVDIYPEERRVEIRGTYALLNRSSEAITELHLNIVPQVTINSLELPESTLATNDEELGYYIYRLAEPLEPGATADMAFDFSVVNRGFVNNGSNTSIVANGTFFNNRDYFPLFGYLRERELMNRNTRREHDLPPVHRMAKVDDAEARYNNYITTDSDWINFETTVSTSADQIAIAPGYLIKEWTDGNRHFFHYKMDAPILHFFAYLSARYSVHHDSWNDVAIDVYYHEPHDYNIERMVESVKRTLDYCTAHYSPYQHRQVRILEFPRYAQFAQSFPNTIPYSESAGFIARVDDEAEDIDYVFYITAHEVAHQWWAHQVIGGNVQGSTMLSEAFAQYTALMIMEQEYGRDTMRRFLKYELDSYLRGRGGELVEEMPLLLVENQPYIHYRKGSLVMYALRDYLGEGLINASLRSYTEVVGFQQPPYTNSLEYMEHLRAAATPEAESLFEDMIETITLFSNRAEEATYARLDDGRYRVALTVEAHKMRCDGQGVETEIDIDDWIDIGVFGDETEDSGTEGKPLYLEKRRITEPTMTFEIIVDEPPKRAGIDPYNKLVDRVTDDNTRGVKEG